MVSSYGGVNMQQMRSLAVRTRRFKVYRQNQFNNRQDNAESLLDFWKCPSFNDIPVEFT